jgi:hypothetical protein
MKLIRFVSTDPSNPSFGIVISNHAVSFSVFQAKTGTLCEFLSDSQAYLAHLPDSEQAARTLLEWGEEHY